MTLEPFLAARAQNTASPAAAIEPLTTDVALQYILADIPFFTVGVFALGAFTFCLVFRKSSWLMFILFASVWMAFAGAILDLVESLALSRGENLSATTDLALTIAREIAFALSFGLRNLWFWLFVACLPPAVPVADDTHVHSGRWQRWGLFGHLLRWAVMFGVLGIVALQSIYRVYTPLASDGPVYYAEATLQVVLSFVFILKLHLNLYLVALDSPNRSTWRRTYLHYLPIILALLVNFGIGLGNLLQFIFSETVLGRFLQAIELYILILSTLISTFYHLGHAPEDSTLLRRKRSSSFNNIPAGSSMSPEMIIPPPRLPSTDLISALQRQFGSDDTNRRSMNRRSSYASRLSTWIVRRQSQRAVPSDQERDQDDLITKQNRAEQGNASYDVEIKAPAPYDPSPMESEPSPSYRLPPQEYAVPDADVPARKGILAAGTKRPTATVSIPERARVRFSNGDNQALNLILPTTPYALTRMESPIYGLNGIINARAATDATTRPQSGVDEDPRTFFDSPRSSGISGLLRQQEELDQSIAALKLFSNDSGESAGARRSLSMFSDEPNRRASSARSIETLSNFPQPPWGRASVGSTNTERNSTETVRQTPPGLSSSLDPSLVLVDTGALPTLNIPGHRFQPSVPSSEISDSIGPAVSSRMNTAGMEITSFIGNLTHPGHKAAGSTETLTIDTTIGSSQSSLEAIKESPTPQQQPYLSDARPTLAVNTSLLSPFPVSPTGWAPDSETEATEPLSISPAVSAVVDTTTGASAMRLQSVSQRRPVGLPSGPKLASATRTRSASPRDNVTSPTPTPF
ncbi:hypothetical protein BC835DRAFT_1525438 [Cytidiella melzeri]|nr:hypothetical protein BC835DRAFT_1525438 [Cytidiella melzeri]